MVCKSKTNQCRCVDVGTGRQMTEEDDVVEVSDLSQWLIYGQFRMDLEQDWILNMRTLFPSLNAFRLSRLFCKTISHNWIRSSGINHKTIVDAFSRKLISKMWVSMIAQEEEIGSPLGCLLFPDPASVTQFFLASCILVQYRNFFFYCSKCDR